LAATKGRQLCLSWAAVARLPSGKTHTQTLLLDEKLALFGPQGRPFGPWREGGAAAASVCEREGRKEELLLLLLPFRLLLLFIYLFISCFKRPKTGRAGDLFLFSFSSLFLPIGSPSWPSGWKCGHQSGLCAAQIGQQKAYFCLLLLLRASPDSPNPSAQLAALLACAKLRPKLQTRSLT